MLRQITSIREVLVTRLTEKRLLSSMFSHVANHITFLAKGFLATRKRTLECLTILMNSLLMLLERNFLLESLVALVTGELAVVGVSYFRIS